MYTNRRVFDWASHERFAEISGDFNPIHMDAIAARRTHSGTRVVHGIHSLVWLLDCFAESSFFAPGNVSLKAQFLQPIYVGDPVSLEISEVSSRSFRARLTVQGEEVLVATIGFEQMQRAFPSLAQISSSPMQPPASPLVRTLEEMADLRGCLGFAPQASAISTLFPAAVGAFGPQRIKSLVCASCLVGMVVPGLHSLFSGLEVSFCPDDEPSIDGLRFDVQSIVARFRFVRISVSGAGLRGTLETVSRMPPVKQPSTTQVSQLVSRNEFSSATALIVGGSRGLGELAAKLVAAGGADVVLTYATGKDDAATVAEEITATGLRCTIAQYDVHRPAAEQLSAMRVIPTHIYYFATPPIFRRKAGLFDLERFAEFNLFYVTAFFDLVQASARLQHGGIRVFYPSTTALDERPANMTEYSMSKAAAEVLCADLSRHTPDVQVLTHRLPRLPTDQTNSVVQVKAVDPIEVLLPIVRQMQHQ